MEQWDLYDENRNLTQKSIERGETIPDGLRHLSVHIWIINSKNEFLIQKRAATKKKFPNMWSMTGGAVLKGENSAQGAIREVAEELGISLDMKNASIVHAIYLTFERVYVPGQSGEETLHRRAIDFAQNCGIDLEKKCPRIQSIGNISTIREGRIC